MSSHLFVSILIFSSVALVSQATAQDASSLTIVKKDDDAYPIVSTELVERMGARKLMALLDEDFLVATPDKLAQLVLGHVGAPQLITDTGIPGIPPGNLPTCQCPEGYVAFLTERLQRSETLFGPQPVVGDTANSLIEELNSQIWNDDGRLLQFDFRSPVTMMPSR